MGINTVVSVTSIKQLKFAFSPKHVPQIVKDDKQVDILNNQLSNFFLPYSVRGEDGSSRINTDLIMKKHGKDSATFFEKNYDVLKRNENRINADKLLLILALMAINSLECLEKSNKLIHLHIDTWTMNGQSYKLSKEYFTYLKQVFAEGIIIANYLFRGIREKTKSLKVKINSEIETKTLTVKKLSDFAKSELVLSNLNYDNLQDYIEKGWLKKNELLDAMKSGNIPKELAIHIMSKKVIPQTEILGKVFGVKSLKELLNSDSLTMIDRMQLYSSGLVEITDLEEYLKEQLENQMPSKEDYKQIARYYKDNIRMLSELLTHNVLDYSSSIEFLEYLEENKCITAKEKEDAVKLMTDFKVDELLNTTTNGELKIVNHGTSAHRSGLTLDPRVRQEYFRSIGGVKQIFIRGAAFIDEEQDENREDVSQEVAKKKSQKNSLDGYQLIIIPEKGVAVLEKFYEVTRNAEGKLEYKRNEKGELIPAIENATYIMPIGLAKDFVESKNKQELIKNPYVTRAAHTRNWVSLLERGIEKVCRTVGTPVSFEKENTDIWSQKVKENYDKLLEYR